MRPLLGALETPGSAFAGNPQVSRERAGSGAGAHPRRVENWSDAGPGRRAAGASGHREDAAAKAVLSRGTAA